MPTNYIYSGAVALASVRDRLDWHAAATAAGVAAAEALLIHIIHDDISAWRQRDVSSRHDRHHTMLLWWRQYVAHMTVTDTGTLTFDTQALMTTSHGQSQN